MPRAYREVRQEDPPKAQELIGGKGFAVKKVDGQGRMVAKGGGKVESDNSADDSNPVLEIVEGKSVGEVARTFAVHPVSICHLTAPTAALDNVAVDRFTVPFLPEP